MTSRHDTKWSSHFPTIAAAAVLAWGTVFATDASAACLTGDPKGSKAPNVQPGVRAVPIAYGDSDSQAVVGMWQAVFTSGGKPYDEVFQKFGSDGLENIISNGLPPAVGNVCAGVWKYVGGRTFKLLHKTWNWSPEINGDWAVPGVFAGTFTMQVTLRVRSDGRSYSGTWVARSVDPAGNPIPSLDADGVVTGRRITVD